MNAFRIRMFLAAAGSGGGGAAPASAPAAAAAPAAAPATSAAGDGGGGRVGAKSGLTPGDQAAMAAMAPAGGAPALPEGYVAFENRPEWLDARFYDPEKKAARIPDLAKSWSEANQKIMAKTEDLRAVVEREFNETRMKARPETPEKYQAKLPETMKLPDGR